AGPDLRVVVGEALLRDPRLLPVKTVRMGEAYRSARLFERRFRGRFSRHFLRPPVPPQTSERGVPDDPVGSPRPELDFGHQLRPDEGYLAGLVGGEFPGERAFPLLYLLEALEQILRHLMRVSGADAAGIDQIAVLVVAEH